MSQRRTRRFYVIAADETDAIAWARHRRLEPRDYVYVSRPERLYGIGDRERPFVVFVGRWAERPNAHELLRVAERLYHRGADFIDEPVELDERSAHRWPHVAPETPNIRPRWQIAIDPALIEAAQTLERTLEREITYIVHHVNGDPHDNRPENLRMVPESEPDSSYDYTAFYRATVQILGDGIQDYQRQAIAAIEATAQSQIDALRDPIVINDHTELDDNLTAELVDLARANQEADFRALASTCVAPGLVDELWAGVRARARVTCRP